MDFGSLLGFGMITSDMGMGGGVKHGKNWQILLKHQSKSIHLLYIDGFSTIVILI